MLLSWLNPVDTPQSGAVLALLVVGLVTYRRLRHRSRQQRQL